MLRTRFEVDPTAAEALPPLLLVLVVLRRNHFPPIVSGAIYRKLPDLPRTTPLPELIPQLLPLLPHPVLSRSDGTSLAKPRSNNLHVSVGVDDDGCSLLLLPSTSLLVSLPVEGGDVSLGLDDNPT